MAARILGPARADLADPGVTLDSWLCVPHPSRVADRLDVYRGGYPARVHDALVEAYPAVAHFTGDAAFAALAQRYSAAAVLTSYNLNDAGAALPAFLRTDPLSAAQSFLPDLAALEWRVVQAFHAEERPPLDPRALGWSADEWARAVLSFQPAIAVVSSEWPLLDLWAARDTPRDQIEIDLSDRPDHVIVRRVDLTVRCESVAAEEARVLRRLLDGSCLGDAVEQLDTEGHDPADVSIWFARWAGAGMITGAG